MKKFYLTIVIAIVSLTLFGFLVNKHINSFFTSQSTGYLGGRSPSGDNDSSKSSSGDIHRTTKTTTVNPNITITGDNNTVEVEINESSSFEDFIEFVKKLLLELLAYVLSIMFEKKK